MNLVRYISGLLLATGMVFLSRGSLCAQEAAADPVYVDSMTVMVFFPASKGETLDRAFLDNDRSLQSLREHLSDAFSRELEIAHVRLRAGASPEGTVEFNRMISDRRAATGRRFFVERMDLKPSEVEVESVGEDWTGLREALLASAFPWRDEVLPIVLDSLSSDRKERLKALEGGRVWERLNAELFPRLRAVRCDVWFVPAKVREVVTERTEVVTEVVTEVRTETRTDTVYVDRVKVDTVYVEREVPVAVEASGKGRRKSVFDVSDRRMLFAVRTNVLAVPFTNVGVEVPLGRHFSVGADWYSPWIWREEHSKDIDTRGWCFEFQALDGELRYWFGSRRAQENQRLLGHSVGFYAAAGHYDFEWDWTGHQGEFANVGVDWLYACPVFGGRAHLEFELGVGYIYSRAVPYDCFRQGDRCFRRPGLSQIVRWFGPTRAQVSLVVPVYVKRKGGAR